MYDTKLLYLMKVHFIFWAFDCPDKKQFFCVSSIYYVSPRMYIMKINIINYKDDTKEIYFVFIFSFLPKFLRTLADDMYTLKNMVQKQEQFMHRSLSMHTKNLQKIQNRNRYLCKRFGKPLNLTSRSSFQVESLKYM